VLIRLAPRGRQVVEGWPRDSGVPAADVEALIRAFEAHAGDRTCPIPSATRRVPWQAGGATSAST
jgi:hypothetical protein